MFVPKRHDLEIILDAHVLSMRRMIPAERLVLSGFLDIRGIRREEGNLGGARLLPQRKRKKNRKDGRKY